MSNLIRAISSSNLTMSSVEISKLTKKLHKNVLADCRSLISEYEKLYINQAAEITALIFSITYKDANGDDQPAFNLSKQATLALMTGYSLPMRHAVNMRWLELEAPTKKSIFTLHDFTNPAIAARAWTDEVEAKQAALKAVESQKQTIQTKDDLIPVSNEASVKAGEILIREFVKAVDNIDLGEKQFYRWMREQRIVSDKNEPYGNYVKAGYFTYKPSGKLLGGKYRYTLRVTPRGKVWLAVRYMAYIDSLGFSALGNGAVV